MNAKEILLDAVATVRANPKTWTQGTIARNSLGYPTRPASPEAVCWCAIGFIEKHANPTTKVNMQIGVALGKIGQALPKVLIEFGSVYYNDAEIKTPEEFISWFEKAAELCD